MGVSMNGIMGVPLNPPCFFDFEINHPFSGTPIYGNHQWVWGTQNGWFISGKILLKWMIWGCLQWVSRSILGYFDPFFWYQWDIMGSSTFTS